MALQAGFVCKVFQVSDTTGALGSGQGHAHTRRGNQFLLQLKYHGKVKDKSDGENDIGENDETNMLMTYKPAHEKMGI